MSEVKVVILNGTVMRICVPFLPSVLRDTPEKVGIVVADNGSTDGSAEMLRAEFRVEVLLDRTTGGYNRPGMHRGRLLHSLNLGCRDLSGWCEPLIAASMPTSGGLPPSSRSCVPMAGGVFRIRRACGGFIDAFGISVLPGQILFYRAGRGAHDTFRSLFLGPQEPAWPAAGNCLLRVGGFDEEFFAHME